MAGASKDKRTGEWIARWYDADGRERSESKFRTRKLALAHGAQKEADAARGLTFDPHAGKTTFRDAAAMWLATRADLKPRTRREYGQMLAPATVRKGDMRTLGLDAVFGGYPVSKITRTRVVEWIADLTTAGKRPSTVRHNYFVLRQVLQHAVDEGWVGVNHAAHIRLPSDYGKPGVVDDPAQFLTPEQVFALTDATPWPYSTMVHVAGWSGLRAGELAGLQIGDVELSPNTNASALHVRRAVVRGGDEPYGPLKTAASRRRVPVDESTAGLLADYIAEHPRRDDPTAPLFPAFRLKAATGARAQRPRGSDSEHWRTVADRQAHTLAALSVTEAAERLELDWMAPLRHLAFYKAVFRPAVLRAIAADPTIGIARDTVFHALRHSWVSICASAGIAPEKISRMAGHTRVSTTLDIYTHVFPDDHAAAMDALGRVARGARRRRGNVIRLSS
jgi:integrase